MSPRPKSKEFESGVKAAVAWLHEEAGRMNDPHARGVLNSAAFHLGQAKLVFAESAPQTPKPTRSSPWREGRMGDVGGDEEHMSETIEIELAESEQSGRRLATVRQIAELRPIEGADRIELAVVDGWHVVTQKGIYAPGDACIYLEIDSWVPSTVAPFLTKDGHYPRVYQGVEGERLKTVRLRGQISQGLLLPMSLVRGPEVGDDVTSLLGILKWERPLPSQLQGVSLGYFPGELRKTDQERIQNCREELDAADIWEVTIKLDGSSMTAYVDGEDMFHVCSRNLRLKETAENAFWKAARKFGLEDHIRSLNEAWGTRVALQGELMGPGIQGNKEGFADLEFFLFDIWDIQAGAYITPDNREEWARKLGIQHVPTMVDFVTPSTLAEVLELATGPSLNATLREGLVFKSRTRLGRSFKAISNEFLLKHGDQ